MKHKTAELEGAMLDAAYAKAVFKNQSHVGIVGGICKVYDDPCGWPGSCWAWFAFSPTTYRSAPPDSDLNFITRVYVRGHTPWIENMIDADEFLAALRSFVASKLGDEVELPDQGEGR